MGEKGIYDFCIPAAFGTPGGEGFLQCPVDKSIFGVGNDGLDGLTIELFNPALFLLHYLQDGRVIMTQGNPF